MSAWDGEGATGKADPAPSVSEIERWRFDVAEQHGEFVRLADHARIVAEIEARADALARVLRGIAEMPFTLESSVHGPRRRCGQCMHAWTVNHETEHHAANCAWVAARALLSEAGK